MARGPTRPHPPLSLVEALKLPQAIADTNAGRPMNRILLAEALGVSPSSSGFRERVMASYRYGLTDGSYSSDAISLTALGEAVAKPRNEHERIESERESFRHVPVFLQILNHFANAKLPDPAFLKNTLERDPFSIDPAWSAEVAKLFIENADRTGFLRVMNGSNYVVVDASTTVPTVTELPESAPSSADAASLVQDRADGVAPRSETDEQALSGDLVDRPEPVRPIPMQVFVAHGRRKKPLEQLKQILNEWQVPFVVAADEAHGGRPISEKVADLMRACTAGIFIFTADDEFQDSGGESVYRPSQNVIYELGAASLLYGRKIVVFKERGVSFPSDFSDLGWIEFERDALDARAMDLLRELIELKAIRLVSTISE